MIVKLFIDNQQLDLFKDESIEVNSSIANVEDISKNTTDYAKSFTVPASSNNNRIFKHYYDANVDNTFDARIRVDGSIELDGLPFRRGSWQLEKVIVKNNNPYSYSINFVGSLFTLKDKLGNDELSVLDLSEFDHVYNSNNIKAYLQTDGDLIYNLLIKKQLYYEFGGAPVNTDALSNIVEYGVRYDQLKPSIRIIKIIEAIETKYNINFSRDFFGRAEFTQLYLWLNNDNLLTTFRRNIINVDFTNTGNIPENVLKFDLVDDTFIRKFESGVFVFSLTIVPSVGYENIPYTVARLLNGEPWGAYNFLTGTQQTQWQVDEDESENKHSFVITTFNVEFKFTSSINVATFPPLNIYTASYPEQTINSVFEIKNNMPKIKIIDFLKGLFSMFKLVVNSEDNTNLYINTINEYYKQGKVWNISRYVKTDTLEVSRAKLLNEIKLKFKEPTTILNKKFKELTGTAYGDIEVRLTDNGTPSGKPLEGESFNIELPFESIIYERLTNIADGQLTNIQYGAVIDDKLEKVNPAPHIFYNINMPIGGYLFKLINDIELAEIISGNINTPSHSLDFVNPQFNLNFDIENNEWTNIASENTLYKNYYKDYLTSIFNIKRRDFSYQAILPLPILLQLKLNDILEIKNNYYRINNFNLNLVSGEIKLNLLNAFDKIIGGFTSNVNQLFADYRAQTQSINIPNLSTYTIDIPEPSWLSVNVIGTNVFFIFTENGVNLTRTNLVTITDLTTLQTIQIFVTQTGNYTPSLQFYDNFNSQYINQFI